MKLFILFTSLIALISGCNLKSEDIFDKDRNYSQFNKEALEFCKRNQFDTSIYFLLDYSIHSGKNRLFIYDLTADTIILESLVTHGSCDVIEPNENKYRTAKFSNIEDSHCSSIGKYSIGKRDVSSWGIGIKYWLNGLQPSNNNAKKRVVVLHSWKAVSNYEIYPNYSPLSWGCPAVSDKTMRALDKLLKKKKQSVLLWIIN